MALSLQLPYQALGLPVVGTVRPLAAPQLCYHLPQVFRRQPHPGEGLCQFSSEYTDYER